MRYKAKDTAQIIQRAEYYEELLAIYNNYAKLVNKPLEYTRYALTYRHWSTYPRTDGQLESYYNAFEPHRRDIYFRCLQLGLIKRTNYVK